VQSARRHPEHRVELDGLERDRQPAAVGLGQQQQILGQLREPVGLLGGRSQRVVQLLARAAFAERKLELGLEDRQRRA
jgi:hypothetical protein